MKTSAIVCAFLAGTVGFSSIAAAAPGDRHGRGDRAEQRQGHRDQRHDNRAANRGHRAHVQHPRPVYTPPRYVHSQPVYRSHVPRFHRGGYLPPQYRQRGYYVADWHQHRGLYAPPHGHQWVQVGSDFLLVAIATGLIANLLVQ